MLRCCWSVGRSLSTSATVSGSLNCSAFRMIGQDSVREFSHLIRAGVLYCQVRHFNLILVVVVDARDRCMLASRRGGSVVGH